MCKSNILLVVFLTILLANAYQDLEIDVDKTIKTMQHKDQQIQKLKNQLNDVRQQLAGYKAKATDNTCQKELSSQKQELQRVKSQCQKDDNSGQSEVQCKAKESKIVQLEKSLKNKGKQLITHLKNFINGEGPYNAQDKELFTEFKDKVTDLQYKIKENNQKIKKISEKKQQIDFEQRYCHAKLSDFNDQIMSLEKVAAERGKTYYIKEIQRLYDERDRAIQAKASKECKKPKSDEEIQNKLKNYEERIKLIENENNELKNLIREIYALKNV